MRPSTGEGGPPDPSSEPSPSLLAGVASTGDSGGGDEGYGDEGGAPTGRFLRPFPHLCTISVPLLQAARPTRGGSWGRRRRLGGGATSRATCRCEACTCGQAQLSGASPDSRGGSRASLGGSLAGGGSEGRRTAVLIAAAGVIGFLANGCNPTAAAWPFSALVGPSSEPPRRCEHTAATWLSPYGVRWCGLADERMAVRRARTLPRARGTRPRHVRRRRR